MTRTPAARRTPAASRTAATGRPARPATGSSATAVAFGPIGNRRTPTRAAWSDLRFGEHARYGQSLHSAAGSDRIYRISGIAPIATIVDGNPANPASIATERQDLVQTCVEAKFAYSHRSAQRGDGSAGRALNNSDRAVLILIEHRKGQLRSERAKCFRLAVCRRNLVPSLIVNDDEQGFAVDFQQRRYLVQAERHRVDDPTRQAMAPEIMRAVTRSLAAQRVGRDAILMANHVGSATVGQQRRAREGLVQPMDRARMQ